MTITGILSFMPSAQADDYYVYLNWNPGVGYTTGINGYIDTNGYLGEPGAEYIFFTGGPSYCGNHTAYIYRVETAGDPNMHPDNPDATGPIEPRSFTLVSTYDMGYYCSGHDNAFYVDDTGIYYGASSNPYYSVHGWEGIYHWDHSWNPIGWEVSTPAPSGTQTLARNPNNGDWWVGTVSRSLYRWDGSSWVYQFTHPNLSGSHHDGMEIIGDSLFISDMTSDVIIQYRLDEFGDVIDPPNTPYKRFNYSAAPYVEGMGYGPNHHIWISGWSSYTIYEIGGGELQIALEGIPDQTIYSGEAFDTFDLDDYTVGVPPFTWYYSGNVDLSVSIIADNVVEVTYPADWSGSETITFEVTDSEGNSASDEAIFTVIALADLCPNEYRWADSGYEWDPFPTLFRSWLEVYFVNSGEGDAYNVTATVTCAPDNTAATDDTVSLGNIPAGGEAWSTDSFTLEVDMTNPQDPDRGICWRVEYDDESGNHHVIEDVAKFCGEECGDICP